MPNQRDIAKRAGVTQATVSMALRNDPTIPLETRERIHRIALEIGYRPNWMVSSLMTQIRLGRPLQDHGCLALVVGRASMKDWLSGSGVGTYQQQYEGIKLRAESLGYRTECFFVGENYTSDRLSDVLRARGIVGVLLAAPQDNSVPQFSWDDFSFATIAYTWKGPTVHVAASHHRHNVKIAWREMVRRGYRRIGFCLPKPAVSGVDENWLAGFLCEQWKLPARHRIPLFISPENSTELPPEFAKWFKRYAPEVIIGLGEVEYRWLESMGIRVPEEVGYACVNRSEASTISGVQENHQAVGAAAVDLLVRQIQNNERGLPECPKLVLLDGFWVEGNSLRPPP